MFTIQQRKFDLVRIGLIRAGCPTEVANTPGNRGPVGYPIVIACNRKQWGRVHSTGYFPSGIVVAGSKTRAALLRHGITRGWAYVEAGSIEIQADDSISCNELLDKLSTLLLQKFYGSNGPTANQPYPYVVECYPFENYMVFSFGGKKYRQSFALDPIEHKVSLQGAETQVLEQFVDAFGESMPRSDTGARFSDAQVKGNDQTFTTGGRSSDLVTSMIRNFKNINEAVEMYLNYVRLCGAPMQWQPPTSNTVHKLPLSADHKLLNEAGVPVAAFAAFAAIAMVQAAKHGTKTVGTGDKVPHDKFAYVGDVKDPSTWKLPIHDASHVKNALARVNQTQGIPDSAKAGVLKKIHRAATKHGVDVSAPTSKQKKWVRSEAYA